MSQRMPISYSLVTVLSVVNIYFRLSCGWNSASGQNLLIMSFHTNARLTGRRLNDWRKTIAMEKRQSFFLLSPKGLTVVFDFSLIGDPPEAHN